MYVNKSYWMYYPGDSGCLLHRFLLPTQFCREEMDERGVTIRCGDGLPDGHDVYAVHGLPRPQLVYALALLKRKGKTIVWSVDDDWLSIPDWNPAKPGEEGLATYELMLGVADHIVCSTRHLASTFHDHVAPYRVHVAPNLLDVKRYPEPPYGENESGRYMALKPVLPVRVVWVGSHTHEKDLDDVVDPLDQLCAKYLPSKMELVFMGMSPPAKLWSKYGHRGLMHQTTVPLVAYQSVVNSINPHVYLAPTAKVPFNLSKSAIRVMEGWALCAAPVATDWGEYAVIENGSDGRLVDTPDQWSSALTRLVTDHEERIRMASFGRMRVEQTMNWSVPQCRLPWIDALSRICGVP